ncbi:MAG TPA: YidC/Oxa1 family membrane protein insertase [Patescibacteria group bacterium]|nr:YidC/Oxa1 family membrane protein insertase [Patescibacteria group bacterium]
MFVASVFEVVIVKPIFNLLVLIYGLLPGHNFGLSIIIFTIVVRLLMWPLVKKQLHQAKAMRELQPEIKKVKKAAKGNRQQESMMLMELYKEREISPFGSLGTLAVQLVILIGLYSGLRRVVNNPHAIITYSYSWLHSLPGIKELAANIHSFDATLFKVVDLKRAAINKGGGFYYPALVIVLGSAIAQFYQSKQLLPQSKDGRKLRDILRDANKGKQAEQSEVNAAVGQSTRYLLPFMIILFTISLPSALSLYWLMSGVVAYIQQARVLGRDEQEMEAVADKTDDKEIIEGEVIERPKPKPKAKKKPSRGNSKKGRKR